MITTVNNLFGVATTVANARAYLIGMSSIRERLCNSFVDAFNYSSSYGPAIYQQVKASSSLNSLPGLGTGTTYDNIENKIYNILDLAFPLESKLNKQILSLGVNATIFAYYNYSDININDVINLIGNVLFYFASEINGNQLFSMDNHGNVSSPFNINNITIILNSGYDLVITALSMAPKDSLTEIVNYNWYESQNIFPQPNLRLMKDIENQYYYVSGQLIYSSNNSLLPDCISLPLVINTITGIIQSSFIINDPCIDVNSYIGPVTGITFNRIFNDGPYSSGDFNSTVQNEYINLDKAVLNTTDYGSNEEILYSFLTGSDGNYLPISYSLVSIDANGIYNINQEYANVPASYECSHLYSSMHIGDNSPKLQCNTDEMGNCTSDCVYIDKTGFKFASLQLDYNTWYNDYVYIKTNPPSPVSNILKRALNILPYSYMCSFDGNSFTATSNSMQCLGYPQITGQNALPNLAFFQSFDSPTFNKIPSLTIYPSIGTSNNGVGNDSDRNYRISTIPLFSGQSNVSIPIGETGKTLIKFGSVISSNFSSDDNIIKSFFGMGDSFNGNSGISVAQAMNAGYTYSGYVINISGVLQNLTAVNNVYMSGGLLGSQVEDINFISGYVDSQGKNYIVSQIYSQDSSGNLIPYYYLDNRNLPFNLQVQENQLYSFSPLPEVFEDNLMMSRLSGIQKVENYLPRYSSGAFINQNETFLYPNAKIVNNLYDVKNNGFPLRIKFVLNIREETVRELYAKYFITSDGLMSSAYPVSVIRPSINDDIDLSQPSPLMTQIFQPNNVYYAQQYDFNNFDLNSPFQYTAGLTMVDNNWSPLSNSYIPSGRNSNIYNNTFTTIFQNGGRITGNGSIQHKIFYGTGTSDFNITYSEQPMANGLFHFYNAFQITGYLLYTPPYFDLEAGLPIINQSIQDAFPLMVNGNSNGSYPCSDAGAVVGGAYYQYIDGNTGIIQDGVDPIFLKYMGGRTGGYLAEQEGGYHPNGLIGDIWNNFSYQRYGMKGQIATNGNCPNGYSSTFPTRWPYYDNNIVLISSTPNKTNIFTRGLSYNPFVISNNSFIPFNGGESYGYSIHGTEGNIALSFSGDYATFSLEEYMPMKNISKPKLYDKTGLLIGPFDRDMEIGVLGNNYIYSNGNLYLNNNQLTDPSGLVGYDINTMIYASTVCDNSLNTGIFPGQHCRNNDFTIVGVIPKGGYANFNLSGINSGQLGFTNTSGNSGEIINQSLITLRPRKMIGASIYDSNIHKGEQGWINPFMFIDNGLETTFSVNTSRFEDLLSNVYNYTTYSQSGILYQVPMGDFTGLATVDSFGNLIYPYTATAQNYWKNYAVKNGVTIIASGWREGSRISFDFTDIEIVPDIIPYQNFKLITPSGTCTLTGEMGYLCQADASIFSAGVVMVDSTDPIPNSFYEYQPSYLSNILGRLNNFYSISGSLPNDVLVAPSIMIQRQSVPIISGGQIYNKLLNYPPYDYNKTSWSAFSDLETYNEGETLEANMPNDPITFTESSLIFSASQGQSLPNGQKNPIINKKFDVIDAYQLYDSIATDAIVNSGKCLTRLRGTQVRLEQQYNLSGVLTPIGTSLSMIKNGFS